MGMHTKPRPFDCSATYTIRVFGSLDADWSDHLSGLVISRGASRADEPETLLAGELTDQAALIGVLNTLYDLGFALISVQRQGEKPADLNHLAEVENGPALPNRMD